MGARAVSARQEVRGRTRHGKSTRKADARLSRPLSGPAATMRIPQQNHALHRPVPATNKTRHAENVVKRVKTSMVNDPLRIPFARRLPGPIVLRRHAGRGGAVPFSLE